MGCLLTLGRVFVIVINVIFLLIGLAFFVVGLIVKFGDSILKKYYESIIESLEKSLADLGYSNTNIDFNLNDLVGNIAIGLIVSGAVLIIITGCGFLGAFKKIKCLLMIYALVVFILLCAQIATMALFYWKPDTIKAPVKESLNATIKSDYAGLNGTNVVSIGWNFVNQQIKCCGIDNYYDFREATLWSMKSTLETPLSCCVTLPSSADMSCAQTPLQASENYYMTGCFDEIWDKAIGNVAITASVLGVCLLMQIIIFLTALCMYADNDKAGGKVKPKS